MLLLPILTLGKIALTSSFESFYNIEHSTHGSNSTIKLFSYPTLTLCLKKNVTYN